MASEIIEIYTIGHSNHPMSRFLALLRQYHIETVVDVRSMPYSRFNFQYRRDTLRQHLEEAHIGYRWDERLGGRQPELPPGVKATPAFVAQREAYRQALQGLVALAAERHTALM